MRTVVQRVSKASVTVEGQVVSEIGNGFIILVGVEQGDTIKEANYLAGKIAKLRIFEDEFGKMNKSIIDTQGEILAVSQFTLCADCKKGNRPSFIKAMEPKTANDLYEYFVAALVDNGIKKVGKGVFGAHMEVTLVNDGPVTIILDTKEIMA